MDLENKAIGFQFELERTLSNPEGFYQDSSHEGDAMERDMFVKKGYDPGVWCNYRNCSTLKTEEEWLCCQQVKAVRDCNLWGVFVLSKAIILSELTCNLTISISICFCNQMWSQNPCHA